MTSEELFQVAQFHLRRGDLLRAEQYLGAALRLGHDPDFTTYWLVRVCVAAGKYQSALVHATQRVRQVPTSTHFRLIVASLHEALGHVVEARDNLEALLREEPDNAFAHYRLAMLYDEALQDSAAAAQHLRSYLTIAPRGPHAVEARVLLERRGGADPESPPSPGPAQSRTLEIGRR